MTTYNYGQLEQLWLNTARGTKYATKTWASLMAAIAMAESSGDVEVVNSIGACGLWQIHPYQDGCKTADTNAKMALDKLSTQGLGAWETWTNGAYKRFLKGNVPPDANLTSSTSSSNTGSNSGNNGEAVVKWGWDWIDNSAHWLGQTITSLIGIPSSIGDVATSIAGLTTEISVGIKLISWLFVPSHWLRILAFFAGVIFLGGSFYMFSKAI